MTSSSPPWDRRSPQKPLQDSEATSVAFPTSFAQQRLWFLHYLDPGSGSYNVPLALRLTGALDVGALGESLSEIVRRHDALRTSFPVREGLPVQVISPARQVPVPEIDLRRLPDAEARQREASREAALEARRPFDLAKGPVLRAKLLRLAEEECVLIVTMHHIVSDGWSLDLLMRELVTLYEAFRLGKPSPLPELPIQYADYALWQRKLLRGEVLDSQLAYWKKQLHGIPALLELLTDRPRSVAPSGRGATLGATLPARILQGLSALARREGATLFMTLLAAFQALLSRYTAQEDILVGSPIAGRTQVETEGLIGFFVNTLVLRGDLSGDPTFRQLLVRTRDRALEAYAHQDLPFERLVEELAPARSLNHSPIFQVLFQLLAAGQKEAVFPELKADKFGVEADTAKFELSLRVVTRPDNLACFFEYKTELFDAETIQRMLEHWERLLEGVVADPDQRVSEISILSEAERRQVVVDWNATARPYPRDESVAQVFETQASNTPDAVALVGGEERVTYGELNSRANRLARILRARGVGSEVPVGVCMEPSTDVIVALLAILKAGGVYVPLDPSYPRERLAFLLRDTAMPLLLAQERVLDRLPATDCVVLQIEAEARTIESQSDENLEPVSSGDALAYVMYTSGSTGPPKGVAIPHRGIVRLVKGVDYVRIDSAEVFLQLAPISFDASTFEIWGPLLNGARLVLFPERVPTPADLRAALAKFRVSILWLTASLFNGVVDADPRTLTGIRQLLIGGESLSVAHVRRALEALPSTTVINGYGPTEGTTFTCCYRIPHQLPEALSSVPIGTPISNTRVYILDRKRYPVPIGVAGELYIAGDGLARGYFNNTDRTAERFEPDPFSDEPGATVYRTGDLARYRRDGCIEFLGRIDTQLKIRGYRIEPGEIEAALRQHPAIASAVVVAREDRPGDRRLVAYVVRADEKQGAIGGVRSFLSEKLPEYMVPSAVVVLQSLPLIASGKIDWRALPPPDLDRSETDGASLPQDTLELILQKIWEDVLGVRPVGVRDNFFELGGHSLLAVRLFADIEKTFGRSLPLATLFQAPTVEGLAERLRHEGWEAPWSSLVVIQGGKGRPPFLCVPGVGGNIVGFYDLARQLGPDQPVYGLQAQGLDGKREPLTRIEDMAAHYIKEIRTVLPGGPYLLGGASFGGSVAFEMARQLEAAGQGVALVALFDAFAPGTTVSLPWVSRVERRLRAYGAQAARHGKNLLFASERGSYLRSKSRTLRRRIRSRIWQTVYGLYRDRSKPLPRVLQDVREAGYLANKEYVPKPFGGKVTLFRAGLRTTQESGGRDLGWGRLALGGVEIRDVPGDHVNMLLRPLVGLLAEQLRESIDKATGIEAAAARQRSPGPITAEAAAAS